MWRTRNAMIEIPRNLFYLFAGFILATITWSAIKHSAVTDDPVLAIALLAMMFFIVGKFFVDRWRPEYSDKDFHPNKIWKMPYTTTRNGLWLRVGFNTLMGVTVYTALSTLLILTTTAQPEFMVLLGVLLILRIPHLYWSMRGRYERIDAEDASVATSAILRYRGGSEMHRRAFLLTPTLMSTAGVALAAVGVLLN